MSTSVLSDADTQIPLAEVRLETSTGMCRRRKRTSRAATHACMRQWSMPYLHQADRRPAGQAHPKAAQAGDRVAEVRPSAAERFHTGEVAKSPASVMSQEGRKAVCQGKLLVVACESHKVSLHLVACRKKGGPSAQKHGPGFQKHGSGAQNHGLGAQKHGPGAQKHGSRKFLEFRHGPTRVS